MQTLAQTKLERFAALVLERNRQVNLTSARDAATLREHIDDSLTLLPYVRAPHVDVGSGAGFPGLVLAIVAGVPVTLIESVGKKARFLQEAAATLELDVTVLNARAEEIGHDARFRERFASASARAVSTAPTVLEFLLPLLCVDGLALVQRGTIEEAERRALLDAAQMLGGVVEEDISVAGSRERHIVLVRKAKPTAPRFPRRGGLARKRPLSVG
ncbi:MAG TPA: 16S rRNA (guanine(527)-N(7))-methyltransferase RsmG [Candidatus Baltobacteraceae bacterium]